MKIRATDMSGRGQLLTKAATYRGAILNGVILLERIIDTYLSCYFTNDSVKRDELMDMLFAASHGISMKPKVVLFAKLVKKNNPKFYTDNKTFFSDIGEIIETRNKFAHYLLDTDTSAIENHINSKIITLIKYSDGETLLHYSVEDMDKIIQQIENSISIANNLLIEFRVSEQTVV